MANSRSAQPPATLWPCSRTSTHLQPAASPSSLQTGCRSSNSSAAEASLWPGAESNCRHADFQSAALPTELPGRKAPNLISNNKFRKRSVTKPLTELTVGQHSETHGFRCSSSATSFRECAVEPERPLL